MKLAGELFIVIMLAGESLLARIMLQLSGESLLVIMLKLAN